jgi:hypothetical protein
MTQDRAALTAQIAGLTRLADVGDTIPGAEEHVAVVREKITDLRAQLAALDAEPEPLLIEAREICGRRDIDFYAEFKEGKYDAQPVMLVALAALRRGMELAAPLAPAAMEDAPILRGVGKITGDGWKGTTKQGEVVYVWNAHLEPPFMEEQYPRVGCEQWSASDQQYDFSPATAEDIAAIRATLSRVPVAAWPGDKELREMAALGCTDEYEETACMRFARRLRAHMTGGASKPPVLADALGRSLTELEIADRVRGLDYAKPDWMGDRCTTETTCAAYGRCMPIFGLDCGAKGGAA